MLRDAETRVRRADQIDRNRSREILAPFLEAGLCEQQLFVDAGAIHQDVDSTQALDDPINHIANLRRIGDIGACGHVPAASKQRQRGLRRLLIGVVVHRHFSAAVGETERNLASDSARAAGDQRYFAIKTHGAASNLSLGRGNQI